MVRIPHPLLLLLLNIHGLNPLLAVEADHPVERDEAVVVALPIANSVEPTGIMRLIVLISPHM